MSVISKTTIIQHYRFCRISCLFSLALLFVASGGLFGQEPQSPIPSDYYSNDFSYSNPQPPSESFVEPLPRIRSLGKLVSIEGRAGDRGSLYPLNRSSGEEMFETGNEMPEAPNSISDQFKLPKLSFIHQEPYTNYRADESNFSYLPGNGDQFGWITLDSLPYLKRGYRSGLTTSIAMHFLGGPDVVPLPPRLYDFSLGYQKRGAIGDFMSYDIASTIGVFSDFEDSARDGIRYPGHGVGMIHLKPELDFVFGVDYLSRDDIKLLPVGGFSWRPRSMQDLRVDMVFPRPRIDYLIDNEHKLYVAGRLGGGTWDIEFPNNDNDVMTVRELQLLFGFEHREANGDTEAWEFGYVFDRRLQFRTLAIESEFDSAFVFRVVSRK
jgi:hypothetical protein